LGLVALSVSACLAETGPVMKMPGRPFAAIATEDGTTLLVSLSGRDRTDGAIAVLHRQGAGFVLVRTVLIDGMPLGLALSHDGQRLALAAGDATLLLDVPSLISGEGQKLLARFPGESEAIYVAFSPDDRLLAISEERARRVTLVDPANPAAPPSSIAVGEAPVGLAFSPDGQFLYATSQAANRLGGPCGGDRGNGNVAVGTVSAIDLALRRVTATSLVGCSPVRIVLSADGAVAFVSLRSENRVAAFLTSDLRIGRSNRLSAAAVGAAPVGLGLSADGTTLLIANSDRFTRGAAGSLTCLHVQRDGRAFTDGGTIASGDFPREVVALPGGAGFVVTLFLSRAVQFLPSACPVP
jgi:DNA-binding beta-propeller fold protein YncE